jgi:1-acyl-sn-glycerol-3-phosphate acyltransferase
MVTLPALINILAYPVSRKCSLRISDYIVKILAPRFFKILSCYKHFQFYGYKDHIDELPDQFMIISNHQSLFDIPCYMNYLQDKDLRFVAKTELGRHIPLVSELLRTQEHCLIPRKASPVTAMKVIEEFGKRVVRRDQIPVLFPEGTRTKDGNVGKFYSAGFRKLAESTRLPVVVCALDGAWKISNMKTIMTNLTNGCYRVKIVKIYQSPQTKEEQIAILEEAPVLIQKQLDEWRKEGA